MNSSIILIILFSFIAIVIFAILFYHTHIDNEKEFHNDWDLDKYYKRLIEKKLYRVLIFSHDFAKAFFGEEVRPQVDLHGVQIGLTLKWKIYLQQMVLEEEPIKYLEQFL